MTDDAELLRRYAEDRSEAAFAELVERNLNLVYFSALRRSDGDAPLAEDITQQVFVSLAQSAASVARHAVPAGWLYVATRNAAANAMRSERRRKIREQEACAMQDTSFVAIPQADWQQLRPQLDAAMDELSPDERDAVLLRCLQDRPFAEIGTALRTTDEAARKRVDRALDKLRGLLAARGITSTSAALGLAMVNQAVTAAPRGLAIKVVAQAVSTIPAGSAVGVGLFTFMSTTKITVATVGLIAIAGAGWFVFQRGDQTKVSSAVATARPAENAAARAASPLIAPRADDTGGAIAPNPAPTSITAARQSTASAFRVLVGAGPVRSTEWANRGIATPAEALETGFWAFDHVDADVLATTLCFGEEKPAVDAFYAALSESVREKYPTPEKLLATLLLATSGGPRLVMIDVPSVKEGHAGSTPTAAVHLRSQRDNGLKEEGDIVFAHTPDGWRRIVPAKGFTALTNAKFPSKPKPAGGK